MTRKLPISKGMAAGAVAALGLGLALLAPMFTGGGAEWRSAPGEVPATPQRAGDPEAGYAALLGEPYVSCGIPADAYARVAPPPDPATLLPGRSGRNADLPYALSANVNEDGVEVISSNCLLCHAAPLEGEVHVGLGDEFLDFTDDPRAAVTRAGTYVRGAAETAAWQHWADRIEGVAPYIQTRTVGVNPATNLTWAIIAHRDPETLAWSDTPLIDPPPRDPIPVSTPPWWHMKKKNAMFYTTIGRGDHARFMMMASMLCADSTEEVETVDAYAADIRAYIDTVEAPDWPHAVDADLAAEGGTVFEAECSRCHGTYGTDETYPNLVVPLDVIGTDPEYAVAQTDGRRDRFYAWVDRSPYGDDVDIAPARGYIAPPLDGIWATAPYLHNGSVPDLLSLLDSTARPTYWRNDPARVLDRERVGWRHERLADGPEAEDDPDLRRRIYDTTVPGYGNDGHTFGDDLTDRQRRAVLEYLKTL